MTEEAWRTLTPLDCAAAIKREFTTLTSQSETESHAGRQPSAESVKRQYQGFIEGVLEGVLYGWCCMLGSSASVDLELFVDGQRMRQLNASEFRPDLLSAGYGNGHHGFRIDASEFRTKPDAVIRIMVTDGEAELMNGGHSFRYYERMTNEVHSCWSHPAANGDSVRPAGRVSFATAR